MALTPEQKVMKGDLVATLRDWIKSKLNAKADKTSTVTSVSYDTVGKKLVKTINETTTDIVSVTTLKTDLALATVASSGSYNDLADKPTIPDVSGTLNRSTDVDIADTNYSTAMARGIYAGTSDMTSGSTSLTSGVIYYVYE